ncbi:MAG: 4'-demethylrebeccamycin synthase [Thermoanaerobaculia bacterium]|nr:4'-demethylrebeccamycin synthase [Thermoanaerobaculia bacterium]
MARFLLASSPEKGHVNPLAPLAQKLKDRGHRVLWLAVPEASPQMEALADEVLEPLSSLARPALATSGPELADLVRNPHCLRGWIRGLLLDPVPAQIEPVRAALRASAPDAIATDPMLYQVILAAHLERIPFGAVSSSLNPVTPEDLDVPHLHNIRSHAEERDQLFAGLGLTPRFRVCDFLPSTFTTVFSTTEYVSGIEVPPGVRLVGPSLPKRLRGDEPGFPWERLSKDKPLLYVSYGSQISYQPEIFWKVTEAARTLGVQVILSAGDLAGSPFPGDVIAVRYAPQLALLPRVSAMVTHGGANSVMEALSHGVPLLISPVCNDQPLQAFFLKRSGAGLALDLYQSSVAETRSALKLLLEEASPIRTAARRVQDSYRRQDGAEAAARLVESLVTGSREPEPGC